MATDEHSATVRAVIYARVSSLTQLDPHTIASQLATLSGRFAVASNSSYQAMSGAPLGLRRVWIDRKPRTSSVWTLNVSSAGEQNSDDPKKEPRDMPGSATFSSSTGSFEFRTDKAARIVAELGSHAAQLSFRDRERARPSPRSR